MDDEAIARWRMHTLRLAGEPYASASEVVGGLLAVQSENHAHAAWAVATRTSGITAAGFDQLFDDGALLRTHVLRPTWHFVLPADIRWLVELTAPRIRRTFRQIQLDLAVDDAALDRSAEVIVEALGGGDHLTRAELGERLGEAGLPSQGQAIGLMMANAELACLVCSGARRGTQQTYASFEQRAPSARQLDRDEALAELALRYFSGHGPATERDLAYWATMTLSDVRAGIAEVRDQLGRLEHDGRTYWFTRPPPQEARLEPRAQLLLVLDEYHNGYQDSRHVLDVRGIAPRGRGANVGMVLVDGQMVGNMRRTIKRSAVTFDVGLFRDLDGGELEALDAAAERCGRFLGLEATVVTTRV